MLSFVATCLSDKQVKNSVFCGVSACEGYNVPIDFSPKGAILALLT